MRQPAKSKDSCHPAQPVPPVPPGGYRANNHGCQNYYASEGDSEFSGLPVFSSAEVAADHADNKQYEAVAQENNIVHQALLEEELQALLLTY